MTRPVVRELSTPSARLRYVAGDLSLLERGQPRFVSTGVYESAETELIAGLIEPGMTFFDVGANLGWYSVLASRLVGPTGTVLAVEPDPVNYALLAHNVAVNGCANVIPLPYAMTDRDGLRELVTSATNRGRHSLAACNVPNAVGVIPVRTCSLPSLAAWFDVVPNVVKIDAEGAEALILVGGRRLLRDEAVRSIWVEVHPHGMAPFGIGIDVLLRVVESLGFRTVSYLHRDEGFVTHVRPRRLGSILGGFWEGRLVNLLLSR